MPERKMTFIKLFKKIKGFTESKKTSEQKRRDKLLLTKVTKQVK